METPNSKADEVAKMSLTLQNVTNIKSPNQDTKRMVKKKYNEEWKTHWNGVNTEYEIKGLTAGVEPKYFELPRREQVKITRLVLQTTLLSHRHYFTFSQSFLDLSARSVWTILLLSTP